MKTLIFIISLLMFSCSLDRYHDNSCFVVRSFEVYQSDSVYYRLEPVNITNSECFSILVLDTMKYKIGDTLKLGIVK